MTDHNLDQLAEAILNRDSNEDVLVADENEMWDLCSMERLQAMVGEWQAFKHEHEARNLGYE